jgi:hypothetical protein
MEDDVPRHGVLARVRQHIPAHKQVPVVPPEEVDGPPSWYPVDEMQESG